MCPRLWHVYRVLWCHTTAGEELLFRIGYISLLDLITRQSPPATIATWSPLMI
jgi:hypothetical protein